MTLLLLEFDQKFFITLKIPLVTYTYTVDVKSLAPLFVMSRVIRTYTCVVEIKHYLSYIYILEGVPATNQDDLLIYIVRERRQYLLSALLLYVYRYIHR